MRLILLVGIGGFLGAIIRFLLGGWLQNGIASFPVGTLGVNVLGSFLLGFVMYSSEFFGFFGEEMRVFLTIGFIGAFTTMSTFGYESFRLFEDSEFLFFALNIAATLLLVFFGVYLGKVTALAVGSVFH